MYAFFIFSLSASQPLMIYVSSGHLNPTLCRPNIKISKILNCTFEMKNTGDFHFCKKNKKIQYAVK